MREVAELWHLLLMLWTAPAHGVQTSWDRLPQW